MIDMGDINKVWNILSFVILAVVFTLKINKY